MHVMEVRPSPDYSTSSHMRRRIHACHGSPPLSKLLYRRFLLSNYQPRSTRSILITWFLLLGNMVPPQ